jgi:hypothetical protein
LLKLTTPPITAFTSFVSIATAHVAFNRNQKEKKMKSLIQFAAKQTFISTHETEVLKASKVVRCLTTQSTRNQRIQKTSKMVHFTTYSKRTNQIKSIEEKSLPSVAIYLSRTFFIISSLK